jgi:2-methylcitrate dehydratase PrpD
LAEFASSLEFEQIPAEVIQRAKDTLADTLAVAMYGSTLPWSQMMTAFAKESGKTGHAQVLGVKGLQLEPNSAALANGSFTHAFESDCLTKPNSGSHPGATVFMPLLALAQTHQSSGRDLLTSFVAGTELMIRVGRGHSGAAEKNMAFMHRAPPDPLALLRHARESWA